MSVDHLIDQGFRDAERSIVVQGFLAGVGVPDRESYYGQHFHRIPFNKRNAETVRIKEDDIEPGEIRAIKVRGAGQFGVFYKALSDQTDWKVSVYTDNDRSDLICEIEG